MIFLPETPRIGDALTALRPYYTDRRVIANDGAGPNPFREASRARETPFGVGGTADMGARHEMA